MFIAGTEVRFEQWLNIFLISVTLLVFSKGIEVIFPHS